jgi:hypothetical protein
VKRFTNGAEDIGGTSALRSVFFSFLFFSFLGATEPKMGAMTTTDPRAVLPLLLALLAASNTGAVGGGSGMTVAADSFVTTLRGDNFQDHVPSRAAGVLVNFYMPWCDVPLSLNPHTLHTYTLH